MALIHRVKDARNLRGEFVIGFRLDFDGTATSEMGSSVLTSLWCRVGVKVILRSIGESTMVGQVI